MSKLDLSSSCKDDLTHNIQKCLMNFPYKQIEGEEWYAHLKCRKDI